MARRRHLPLPLLALVLCGATALPPAPPPLLLPNVTRVVVDVDAGADDAMALLMLLGQETRDGGPKVEAITCLNGNTALDNVVRNVYRVLDAAGRLDVPVYAGAARSLVRTPYTDGYFGIDGFGDFAEPTGPQGYKQRLREEHAASALVRMAKDSPGELSVLFLGPLTNAALAEVLWPGFVSLLRHAVVLGGSTEGHGNVLPGVEFNFHMDPESAHVVLEAARAAGRPLLLVPWETVKLRSSLPLAWRQEQLGGVDSAAVRLLNGAEGKILARAASGGRSWAAADAVAAAVMLRPALVASVTAPLHAAVETGGSSARATLQVDYSNMTRAQPNVRIVRQLDLDGYKQLLLSTLA